jgi:diguanylate cyclase (GGDEF)-like protein
MAETQVVELLGDIRSWVGGDIAVVWQVEPNGTATALAFSSADGTPPELDVQQRGILVWAAQQASGELSSAGDPVSFIATPIAGGDSIRVLSVFAQRAIAMPKNQYKHWLPRLAARLGTLMELVASYRMATRTEQQTTILLDTAKRLHESRSVDVLGEQICGAAREMTDTKRAALIRWNAAVGAGEVAYSTRGHLVSEGASVTLQSQTGAACAGDYIVVLDDARNRGDGFTVYGGSETARSLGSLAIIPLRGRESVIGALVIEGDRPGQISSADTKNLRLLGLLAAASLETVWEIEEISRLARTDPLTGLANRQAFEERLGQLVLETDRFGGSGALIVVDVDHFKHVNDTYGHQVGDQVLRRLADILLRAIRTVDLCARYGGEELALLLPQTSLSGACQMAERLRQRVADQPFVIEGREIPITISLGVAAYPEGARDRDELFAAADRALYTAKRAGRNRVIADVV